MSKRYSGKSFKDSSVMKKPKLTFKEKRKLKEEKKEKMKKFLTTNKVKPSTSFYSRELKNDKLL